MEYIWKRISFHIYFELIKGKDSADLIKWFLKKKYRQNVKKIKNIFNRCASLNYFV